MAGPNNFYVIQPNCAGGEISQDVASRIDLDKYSMALLQAENAVVRPYGSVQKRTGTIFCGETKYADKKSILVRFDFTVELSYMLEIGYKYIRIWKGNTYLNKELATPFEEADLPNLRFVQSVDVVYITSGKYPVKKLMRYAEDDWRIEDMEFYPPAFGDLNKDEDNYLTPSGTTGIITITATKDTFTADMVGNWIKIEQRITGKTVNNTNAQNEETRISGEYGTYKIWSIEITGSWEGEVKIQKNDNGTWTDFKSYTSNSNESGNGNYIFRIVIKLTLGNCNVRLGTILQGVFETEYFRDFGFTKKDGLITDSIVIGDTWKIITHGTWTGSVIIEKSVDNGATWLQERQYTSNDDYNPTESGSVEEYCLMRLVLNVTSGSCKADLSSYPYTHTGYARIIEYTNAKQVKVQVQEGISALGSTEKTIDWYLSAWSKQNGYPMCCMFFQDRLVFAGSTAKPSRIWLSKTGDYGNFSVDKEAGTVTDDSAITADLINLKAYTIKHVDAGNDLMVMTEGNEWSISGGETVTPTNITPRNQQNYGCNDTIPVRVSNRIVYVQRRGSIIRDMGYSYDTDSYIGMDLTLLAKHLIRNHEISYSTFTQEPDSVLYFVRDDGVLICLTYVPDQKVYAWWHIVTDGKIEVITSTAQANNDVIYAVINRTINGQTKRYIEQFVVENNSTYQQDHIMTDCTKIYSFEEKTTELTGLEYLEGKEVYVMSDGYLLDKMTVAEGKLNLPKETKNAYVGLPYTMIIEQPNFDITTQDTGTMQARKKAVQKCILRLQNSYGGYVGANKDCLDNIRYDNEYMQIDDESKILYSGDLEIPIRGGFNNEGRIYIKHDTPYSFSVSAIIRSVTLGSSQ